MSVSEKSWRNLRKLIEKIGVWQGHRDSNSRPTVLETVALPTELYPFRSGRVFLFYDFIKGLSERLLREP